ncbi:amidohydrolase [Alkalibacillus salilacus]|uniref:Amidohydrolase YtcJ n=1 Tax=Alkalibacillus salilacus TaxID=284582 RepID=A0ABT9VI16_9BACI|nr:amidohydrolase [Alkalibacillus salilacus]MDQ0160564.1 putative amidohydrolase YtcJ [Alkalibacillus salilacus]
MVKVDTIYKNGRIYSFDASNHVYGSLTVADGVITGVWESTEPPQDEVESNNETSFVDLDQATMIPGFIDTHNHILMYAKTKEQIDCNVPPNEAVSDVLNAISEQTNKVESGSWIEGFGYDDTMIAEKRHLNRKELDDVAPHHPLYIRHISGHLAYVNSKAIEMAGLDDYVEDFPGGHFGRNEDGNLNGVLYEPGAMQPFLDSLPKKSTDELVQILKRASDEYLTKGITTNSDAAIFNMEELDVHLRAAKERANPIKTRVMMMHYLVEEGAPFGNYTPEELNRYLLDESDGLVSLDSIKMFQDGSIQGMTGALREPYYNDPTVMGEFIHEEEDFKQEVLHFHKRGFRITTHGNGDRAIRSIIDAYEYALNEYPRQDHRHRIEHVQTALPEDLERMKRLGIAASFFINHVYYWGDRHRDIFLGPERAERINPLKEASDNGLLYTLHSDCPITPISPIFSIWAAVNRLTRNGYVLGNEQKIDLDTAIRTMTIEGAKLNFEEGLTGSIEEGKQADLITLSHNPYEVDLQDLKDIKVAQTIIDGKVVYSK